MLKTPRIEIIVTCVGGIGVLLMDDATGSYNSVVMLQLYFTIFVDMMDTSLCSNWSNQSKAWVGDQRYSKGDGGLPWIQTHNAESEAGAWWARVMQQNGGGVQDLNLLMMKRMMMMIKDDKPTTWNIRFIDSFEFFKNSLSDLVNTLDKSTGFRHMPAHFPDDKVDMLLRKGVFPFEYVDSWAKYDDPQLPPHEAFYSKLYNTNCSADDYAYAQHCFRCFSIAIAGGVQ